MELGFQVLLESFLVHLIGSGHLLTSRLIDDELGLGLGVRDEEDAVGLGEAARVSVKDVAPILAVVLVQAPPDCLVDQVDAESFPWVRRLELLYSSFDIDVLVFIVGVSFWLFLGLLLFLLSRGLLSRRFLRGWLLGRSLALLGLCGFFGKGRRSGSPLAFLLLDSLLLCADTGLDLSALGNAVLFLLVPGLYLLEHVLQVDVRHVVVLGKLFSVEGLA